MYPVCFVNYVTSLYPPPNPSHEGRGILSNSLYPLNIYDFLTFSGINIQKRSVKVPEEGSLKIFRSLTLLRGASLDTIVTGRDVRPGRKAVATVSVETRLIIPKISILKIKHALRAPGGIVNSSLTHGFADGFPASDKPAGDVFLKDQKRRHDRHDQRDVFD